jgi:hypothetical protein
MRGVNLDVQLRKRMRKRKRKIGPSGDGGELGDPV